MSDVLLFEVKEKIAYLTLNRPESRNAINVEMYNGINFNRQCCFR